MPTAIPPMLMARCMRGVHERAPVPLGPVARPAALFAASAASRRPDSCATRARRTSHDASSCARAPAPAPLPPSLLLLLLLLLLVWLPAAATAVTSSPVHASDVWQAERRRTAPRRYGAAAAATATAAAAHGSSPSRLVRMQARWLPVRPMRRAVDRAREAPSRLSVLSSSARGAIGINQRDSSCCCCRRRRY